MTSFPTVYEGLQPVQVWQHFGALNAIPRPSGKEDAARAYVQQVAEQVGATWKSDTRGNIVVTVPTKGAAIDSPIVTLQSHLDMVCQKRPEVSIDFDTDPIIPQRRDDKIYATGTTLGADNGMGAAMMLALLTSPEIKHGPLELLFTVEEETGLFGAAFLDPTLVDGRLLINLDSEDPDEITIGCAGGASTSLFVPITREASDPDAVAVKINVSGLSGGHSGIQIGEPLANAIQLLGLVLKSIAASCPGLKIVSVEGGTAHNAIPRDAEAVISLSAIERDAFGSAFETVTTDLNEKWLNNEAGLKLTSEIAEIAVLPVDAVGTANILNLLTHLPHGVVAWSSRFEGKVQTSSNFCAAHTSRGEVEFSVSNRSFVAAELQGMQAKVADLGQKTNARIVVRDGYPGWEPSADSPLVAATARAYEESTGRKPKVEVVHAGLECGLLSEKLPGLDAVSFGPLIRGAHTPEEWVSIPSVAEMFGVLTTLLGKI